MFDLVNVASIQLAIQLRVFEQSCRRSGITNQFIYLLILAPLLSFLGAYKSYYLYLPGACLILLIGSVFILQFNFEFLMINHQEYTSENVKVSWIILISFLLLILAFPLYTLFRCPQEHLGLPRSYLQTITY
jgi:hypothetical protein